MFTIKLSGYTATDDLWPTRVAGRTTPGYTATDDLWK